jgi:hypothetical protein
MTLLPAFSLNDLEGHQRSFPNNKASLLCFVREECETCHLSMPVIETVYRAYGDAINLWVVGQEENQKLRERYRATVPILDDTALKVSFAYQVEIVPTIIFADASGAEVTRWEAFHQGDWKALISRLSQLTVLPEPAIDWTKLPALRPGCGSRSVEPGIHERLVAEAQNSPNGWSACSAAHGAIRRKSSAPAHLTIRR